MLCYVYHALSNASYVQNRTPVCSGIPSYRGLVLGLSGLDKIAHSVVRPGGQRDEGYNSVQP